MFSSSPATPVLGRLPLTNDDFWTHRAPIPAPYMIGPTTRPFAAPTGELCLSYAFFARYDTTRPPCARRTRSQTTVLTGNVPSCSDYRTVARSGFTASAAPAPSPKVQLHSSPPPRSTRLGSTIPLGRHASPRPTLAPNPQLQHSPPAAPPVLQTTAPDNDTSIAAEPLSNTLLSYSLHGWEQAQRMDPLCDATRHYIQLGCLNPLLSLFAITSHRTRGLKTRTPPTSPPKSPITGR